MPRWGYKCQCSRESSNTRSRAPTTFGCLRQEYKHTGFSQEKKTKNQRLRDTSGGNLTLRGLSLWHSLQSLSHLTHRIKNHLGLEIQIFVPLKRPWSWLVSRPLWSCHADFLRWFFVIPEFSICSLKLLFPVLHTQRLFFSILNKAVKRLLFSPDCPQLLLLKWKSYSSINALVSWVFISNGEHSQQFPGCVCI